MNKITVAIFLFVLVSVLGYLTAYFHFPELITGS